MNLYFIFLLARGIEETSVSHCHGTQDSIVKNSLAVKNKDLSELEDKKNYSIKTYPRVQYNLIGEELNDALTFIKSKLPTLKDANLDLCIII